MKLHPRYKKRKHIGKSNPKSQVIMLKTRLNILNYSNLWDYIKSDTWKQFKLSYYTRHVRECSKCKSTTNLNLHHLTYIRLGKELDRDVTCLCERCHKKKHNIL